MPRKKLLAIILGMAALAVASAVVVLQADPAPAQTAVLAATAPPPPVPAAVAQEPVKEEAEEGEEGEDGEEDEETEGHVTQTLKGKDFSLQVTVNGNARYRNLDVTMADGTAVKQIQGATGELEELGNAIFSPGDTFELKQVLADEPREQIICKGSDYLNAGEGSLDTYTVYRLKDGKLQKLISVITEREREEGNGPPPQKLAATIEQTVLDGQPAFLYRVKVEKQAERTIEFRWDGKQFTDASGEYAKIAEKYLP